MALLKLPGNCNSIILYAPTCHVFQIREMPHYLLLIDAIGPLIHLDLSRPRSCEAEECI
jgi:hypothetical protein